MRRRRARKTPTPVEELTEKLARGLLSLARRVARRDGWERGVFCGINSYLGFLRRKIRENPADVVPWFREMSGVIAWMEGQNAGVTRQSYGTYEAEGSNEYYALVSTHFMTKERELLARLKLELVTERSTKPPPGQTSMMYA